MKLLIPIIAAIIFCSFCAKKSFGQEETSPVHTAANKYISLRIHSLEKYNTRVKRQQEHLIKKLKRKESKLAHKLRTKDSVAYARFQSQKLSYDSIGRLIYDDTTINPKLATHKNRTIDSLKVISGFVGNNNTIPQSQKISQLQSNLNYRNYINDLLSQRTTALKQILLKDKIPLMTSIEKNTYYGKRKMSVFKQMEEEPTKAEDQALEYLQGTKGFNEAINNATNPNTIQGLSNDLTASDLEKKGYQTKQMLQQNLSQKFGNSTSQLTQQMSGQLKDWKDEMNGIKTTATNAKQTQKTFSGIRNTQKPSFKVNPMRGLPFAKRLEKQFSFQTTRPTASGDPAMLQLSAMCGFKHTARLTYGLGLATGIGLGQDWNNIRFTLQNAGFKTFATYKWLYGIQAYAGYERMFRHPFFANTSQQPELLPTPHSTSVYTESVLVGLCKTYRINNKWNGSVQLLYDIWWQQKGLQSPLQIRFSTIAK